MIDLSYTDLLLSHLTPYSLLTDPLYGLVIREGNNA